MKRISGTKEWSTESVNCVTGCSHGCRYCYARFREVKRFKRVKAEDWETMVVRERAVTRRQKRRDGRIMFPSSHDITPEVSGECIAVLSNLLEVGNQVLIVTKPHFEVVKDMIFHLRSYRDQILFRFTIGCMQDSILAYWEPGAPRFPERFKSLIHAFKAGFRTSVSSEPLLDVDGVWRLGELILPFINDAWWIGKMNDIDKRVDVFDSKDTEMVRQQKEIQTDHSVKWVYNQFKDNPKVKWKESYKEVVGLSLARKAGEDK